MMALVEAMAGMMLPAPKSKQSAQYSSAVQCSAEQHSKYEVTTQDSQSGCSNHHATQSGELLPATPLATWKDMGAMSKMLERRLEAAVTKHMDSLEGDTDFDKKE